MSLDFSRYDTRHYRTVAVREGYAAWPRHLHRPASFAVVWRETTIS